MAATRRYDVDTCGDDPELLSRCLRGIADDGGRVISVAWRTKRQADIDDPHTYAAKSGYTVVSEHEIGVSDRWPRHDPAISNRWHVGGSLIGAARGKDNRPARSLIALPSVASAE